MLRLRTAIVSLLLVSACSVGEVPTGGGTPTPTPDAAQTGNGGIDAAPTGGVDAAPTGGTDPATVFTSTILPLLQAQSCVGCHPAQSPPDLTSYTTIDAKYLTQPGASAKLITSSQASSHTGTKLSATAATTIAAWIDTIGK